MTWIRIEDSTAADTMEKEREESKKMQKDSGQNSEDKTWEINNRRGKLGDDMSICIFLYQRHRSKLQRRAGKAAGVKYFLCSPIMKSLPVDQGKLEIGSYLFFFLLYIFFCSKNKIMRGILIDEHEMKTIF